MADVASAGSEEAATRAVEEQAFYHEAALNAAWTGSRLAIGGLSFLFGAFAFAYFYLQSANSHEKWLPSSTTPAASVVRGRDHGPDRGERARADRSGCSRSRRAARRRGRRRRWSPWCFGLSAVALQIVELLTLPFQPGQSGFASVFVGFYPVALDHLALCHDLAGDIVHAGALDPGHLVRRAAAHLQ